MNRQQLQWGLADNLERAKAFYRDLFGWKMERFPGPIEYWHLDTGGPDAAPDGTYAR